MSILRRLILVLLLFSAVLIAGQKELRFKVVNPLAIDRSGEIVVIPWKQISTALPSLKPETVEIREAESGKIVLCQFIPDRQELVFQSDFKSRQKKEFLVSERQSPKPTIQSLTDVRFVLPREDVAWENDRIAFRAYGPALAKDVKSGIDVWTKRVRYLIVEKWYKNDSVKSYHTDWGEGADFFSVGKTLGAGSCALWENGKLIQPGVFSSYKIITTGPLKAIFELNYAPVEYKGMKVSEVERISLDAGSNLNTIEVLFTAEGKKRSLEFAAGVVKRLKTQSRINNSERWVSLWGPTNDKEENGSLGTAVLMPKPSMRSSMEDTVHVLLIGRATLGKPVVYYSGAGWTRSGDFKNAKDWEQYLTSFSQKVQKPLIIKVSATQ
ncbi:MAG: DUF4861 family protein [bacterium]